VGLDGAPRISDIIGIGRMGSPSTNLLETWVFQEVY